jgi:hypothetical protein
MKICNEAHNSRLYYHGSGRDFDRPSTAYSKFDYDGVKVAFLTADITFAEVFGDYIFECIVTNRNLKVFNVFNQKHRQLLEATLGTKFPSSLAEWQSNWRKTAYGSKLDVSLLKSRDSRLDATNWRLFEMVPHVVGAIAGLGFDGIYVTERTTAISSAMMWSSYESSQAATGNNLMLFHDKDFAVVQKYINGESYFVDDPTKSRFQMEHRNWISFIKQYWHSPEKVQGLITGYLADDNEDLNEERMEKLAGMTVADSQKVMMRSKLEGVWRTKFHLFLREAQKAANQELLSTTRIERLTSSRSPVNQRFIRLLAEYFNSLPANATNAEAVVLMIYGYLDALQTYDGEFGLK